MPIEATFAGSGCLLAQAELAGRGDVFIPGELHYVEQARERGLVGDAVSIAYLNPVIVVEKGNPFGIAELRDLARPELRLGLGDPQSVAVGIAAERWLAAELDEATRAAVLERVTTRALNVNELGSQLTLGALDAAIVWDATVPLFPQLTAVVPPSSKAYRTLITGSVLKMSEHAEDAARFLSFLVGEEGRSIFRKFGYTPVAPAAAVRNAADCSIARIRGPGDSVSNTLFRSILLLALAALVTFVGAFLAASILYSGPHRVISILAQESARDAVMLSLATSAIATILSLLFGIPTAYALTRWDFPGKTVLDVLLDLPIVLPPLVAGFGLLLLYALLDRSFHGSVSGSPLDLRFTREGIVLAQFTIAAPLAVRVLRATFSEVPVRIETMSRSLGVREAGTFLRVSLPMARSGILAGTILVWARSIAEFGPILVFSGAVRGKTDVLPISIFLAFSNGEIENGVAFSVLLILLGAVALVGIRRLGGRLVVG